jgi:cell shape-determining protein MreC
MRREGKIRSSKLFWVTLSLVSLYCLSFLLPQNFFLPFRFVFQTIVAPFEAAVSGTGFFLRDFGGTFFMIGDLKLAS